MSFSTGVATAESDLDLPTLWLRKRNWRVRLDLEKKKGREKKQAKHMTSSSCGPSLVRWRG